MDTEEWRLREYSHGEQQSDWATVCEHCKGLLVWKTLTQTGGEGSASAIKESTIQSRLQAALRTLSNGRRG